MIFFFLKRKERERERETICFSKFLLDKIVAIIEFIGYF